MKQTFKLLRVLLLFTAFSIGTSSLWAAVTDSLLLKIAALKNVSSVQRLESTQFKDKYVLFIEQPLDQKNPSAGSFKQRIFVMNAGEDRPTVIVTEGYGAAYAASPRYRDEISRLLNANIIFVEHRYFLESTPKPLNWKYLTAENSAFDLHNVTTIFKQLYKGKWIATGISKGGQTALIYRAFFPDDVDVSVPYVAPLCKGREDGRHEPFLRNFAGTQQEREILTNFQKEVLKRRGELQPKFDSLCNVKGYKFNLPLEEIYDYSILELPFSFWQWGSPIAEVPGEGAVTAEIFKYWMKTSSPDYFINNSPTAAFFVQANRELGYYGYDTKPFKGLLKIKNSKGYMGKLFIPRGAEFKFDKALYKKLKKFVATTDEKMLFIYGEFDPWSSVKVNEPKNDNVVVLVEPKGSHRSRISTMPEDLKKRAVETLNRWLAH